MSVAKPSIVPLWGTGSPIITTPPSGKQTAGWVSGDVAVDGWLNYLFVPLTQWAQFWNEKVNWDGTTLSIVEPVSMSTSLTVGNALTVSAGGAAITGAVTMSSTLTVTGVITQTSTSPAVFGGDIKFKKLEFNGAQNGTETQDGIFKLINAASTGMLEPVLWSGGTIQPIYFERVLFHDHSLPSKTMTTSYQQYATTSYAYPGNSIRVGTMIRVRVNASYVTTGSTAAHTLSVQIQGMGSSPTIAFPIPAFASTNTINLDMEFVFLFTANGASATGRWTVFGACANNTGTAADNLTVADFGSIATIDVTFATTMAFYAKTSAVTGSLQINNYYMETL